VSGKESIPLIHDLPPEAPRGPAPRGPLRTLLLGGTALVAMLIVLWIVDAVGG
jgi:hypothetical protein